MTEFNPTTPDVIIYYNSACETSRNTLALIRITGIKPHIIEYLKLPLNRDLLLRLVRRMGVSLRSIQREKGTPYSEFQLERPDLIVDELLDAIGSHPILINRPIVLTPRGVRLCWPSDQNSA